MQTLVVSSLTRHKSVYYYRSRAADETEPYFLFYIVAL
jgi:hypothetical protein